jgi:hypothetical protein
MNSKGNANGIAERLKIQEKALSNLADSLKKHESEINEEVRDVLSDLKALKLFLSRNIPEFKKEFPEIRRKLK